MDRDDQGSNMLAPEPSLVSLAMCFPPLITAEVYLEHVPRDYSMNYGQGCMQTFPSQVCIQTSLRTE
jgi:hypothetical protein